MISLRILGLTALTLLSIVPLVKPAPPTLTTQFFSQPVTFSPWANLLSNSSLSTPNFCGKFVAPGTSPWVGTFAAGLNFTVTLAKRDPGSTFIHFNARAGLLTPIVYHSRNITSSLLSAICTIIFTGSNASQLLVQQAQSLISSTAATAIPQPFSPGNPLYPIASSDWRVPASGTYSLLNIFVFDCPCQPTSNLTGFLTATESWTVTTIR